MLQQLKVSGEIAGKEASPYKNQHCAADAKQRLLELQLDILLLSCVQGNRQILNRELSIY